MHPVRRPFEGLRSRKSGEARFGDGVHHHVAAALPRGPRRNVDDLARAAFQHVRPNGAGAQDRLGEIDVHDAVDFVFAQGGRVLPGQGHQRLVNGVTQIVDEDVDAPEGLHHQIHRLLHAGSPGDVGDYRNHPAAAGFGDFGGNALDVARRQRVDRHVGAGLGEHLGDALADAPARAGDENHFVLHVKSFWKHARFLAWKCYRPAARRHGRNLCRLVVERRYPVSDCGRPALGRP